MSVNTYFDWLAVILSSTPLEKEQEEQAHHRCPRDDNEVPTVQAHSPDGASLNCKVHSRSICIRTAGCKLHSSVLIEMPHRMEPRRIEPPSRGKGEKM